MLVNEPQEPADPAQVPAVSARGIDVQLDGHQILFDVDLTVNAGQVVALLGANGSGKSTLVRTVLGITPHSAGQIRLLGEPLGSAVPWARIGYVPQRLSAGGGIPATAVEVVQSGLVYGHRLHPGRGAHRRAMAALEEVGMTALAKRSVLEMSGGQQQRVLIARALVRDPQLLVLDEPTSGIDLPTQETFVDTVRRLHDGGSAVLVILHEIGSFSALIDRTVVLRHGRVVHDGPPPTPRGEHAVPGHDHTHPHADVPPESGTGLSMEVLP